MTKTELVVIKYVILGINMYAFTAQMTPKTPETKSNTGLKPLLMAISKSAIYRYGDPGHFSKKMNGNKKGEIRRKYKLKNG